MYPCTHYVHWRIELTFVQKSWTQKRTALTSNKSERHKICAGIRKLENFLKKSLATAKQAIFTHVNDNSNRIRCRVVVIDDQRNAFIQTSVARRWRGVYYRGDGPRGTRTGRPRVNGARSCSVAAGRQLSTVEVGRRSGKGVPVGRPRVDDGEGTEGHRAFPVRWLRRAGHRSEEGRLSLLPLPPPRRSVVWTANVKTCGARNEPTRSVLARAAAAAAAATRERKKMVNAAAGKTGTRRSSYPAEAARDPDHSLSPPTAGHGRNSRST